ncbi:helix-turn-helix transcriptional regulator [Crenothrix sp.]|uniref:helix-turn-helix transcriptional regulator n=1 Tax=Crenothrix sp. TaxID=3100433 RepID=UPI00374D1F5F
MAYAKKAASLKPAVTTQPSKPQFKPDELPKSGYIRINTLVQFIPFSKTTIWRKCRNGTFPAAIKLSDKITAFSAEAVHEWLQGKETV